MKINKQTLCFVFLVTLAVSKASPTPEPKKEDKNPAIKETPREPEVPKEVIAVEEAEEPKQADRAKKSATTTFCVEIRPGPNDQPTKVCEDKPQNPFPPPPPPPQYDPQPPQEITVDEPILPPLFQLEPNMPLILVPSSPPPVYIPQEPLPEPQPVNPCPPCPSATAGAHAHAHALIALLRSAMTPQDKMAGSPFYGPSMDARSSNWAPQMDSEVMFVEPMENSPQTQAMEAEGSPFARTHSKKLYGQFATPYAAPATSYSAPAAGYQRNTPYIVQCNPQVVPLNPGAGASQYILPAQRYRDASGNPAAILENAGDRAEGQAVTVLQVDPQMMAPSQTARSQVYQPYVQFPSSNIVRNPAVFHHTSTFQTYQSQQSPLQALTTQPGYSAYTINPQSGVLSPAYGHHYRREGPHKHRMGVHHHQPMMGFQRAASQDVQQQQQPQPIQQIQPVQQTQPIQQTQSVQQVQQPQQPKLTPCDPSPPNSERSSADHVINQPQQTSHQMSPSQMINQMRGAGAQTSQGNAPYSFQRANPVMQSFPREPEAPNKEGAMKLHMPTTSQSFMFNGPMSGMKDENMAARREEMAKREVDKIDEDGA